MKPQFHQTVNILVQAYLNDELEHKVCSACAVGNIVAAAIGTRPNRVSASDTNVMTFDNNEFENGDPAHHGWYSVLHGFGSDHGFSQIEATGYSRDELLAIERAFENAPGEPDSPGLYPGKCTDPEWMFNGLMAVVDVLAEIHGIDLTTREESKLLFAKP